MIRCLQCGKPFVNEYRYSAKTFIKTELKKNSYSNQVVTLFVVNSRDRLYLVALDGHGLHLVDLENNFILSSFSGSATVQSEGWRAELRESIFQI